MTATINPQTTFTFIEVEQVYDFIEENATDEMDPYVVRRIVDMVMGGDTMAMYYRDWVMEQLHGGANLDWEEREYLEWMENFYDAHPFLDNIIICEVGGDVGEHYYELINGEN